MFAVLRQRNFALLWFGGLISYIGDWVILTALPIYIFTLTKSVLATGLMFAISMVPSVLLGSVAGVFVDRWDRRWTMVIAHAMRAPLWLMLIFVDSPDRIWIVYLVAFASRCIGQFAGPAEDALLPKLVGEEHLLQANALNSLNNNLARLIGPALGGLVFAAMGFGLVVILEASSFFIAGVMVALINAPTSITRATHDDTQAEEEARPRSVFGEWQAGIGLVRRNSTVAALFVLLGFNAVAEGILSVLMVIYVTSVLGGGAPEFGWFLTAQAVGGLLGGMFVGQISKRVAPRQLVGPGFLLLGVIDVLIFNIPNLPVGLVLMAVVGLPVVALQAGVMTLFQKSVPDHYRGRVLGAYGTTYSLVLLTSTLFTSFFGSAIGVVFMLSVAGTLDVLAGIAALKLLPITSEGKESVAPTISRTPELAGNTTAD
jgi:MFS family permease